MGAVAGGIYPEYRGTALCILGAKLNQGQQLSSPALATALASPQYKTFPYENNRTNGINDDGLSALQSIAEACYAYVGDTSVRALSSMLTALI